MASDSGKCVSWYGVLMTCLAVFNLTTATLIVISIVYLLAQVPVGAWSGQPESGLTNDFVELAFSVVSLAFAVFVFVRAVQLLIDTPILVPKENAKI